MSKTDTLTLSNVIIQFTNLILLNEVATKRFENAVQTEEIANLYWNNLGKCAFGGRKINKDTKRKNGSSSNFITVFEKFSSCPIQI